MGMKVSNEWADNKITYFGTNRQQQPMSLRKKLSYHKETAAHKAALKILTEAEAAPIENLLLKELTHDFLRRNLVSLTWDGAAVMLGSNRGVKALLKEKFRSVLVWHCANHRL
ncbi:E3 SUMO-protein ligase, partial [Biomphalaria glabrata]